MKFYEFVDKQPPVGKLVIVEGTERVLADRAVEILTARLLPADLRELNLARFTAEDTGDFSAVREAVAAMPFLAERRVTIVTEAQTLKTQPRRELLAVAAAVPEGNTLIVTDLLSARSKRPEPLGPQVGRAALRIDTTAGPDVRARYVEELLAQLGAKADRRAIDALARGEADLTAVRNDLEKLALQSKSIGIADLQREALSIEDPKGYEYAGALLEGRTGDALAIAGEMFFDDARAAVPLLSALANECAYVWALTQPGGSLPARIGFKERTLRPLARRIGARRARRGYERAVDAVAAVVTGRVGAEEQRALVEQLSVELSGLGVLRK